MILLFKSLQIIITNALCVSVLTGCSIVKSVQEQFKGEDCYKAGDYHDALIHFKEAEKCPTPEIDYMLSRTYLAIDDIDNAWFYARGSTIGDDRNIYYAKNLVSIWKRMKDRYQIQIGSMEKDVIEWLGHPNYISKGTYNCGDNAIEPFQELHYGLIIIKIKLEKIDQISFFGSDTKNVQEWSDLFYSVYEK